MSKAIAGTWSSDEVATLATLSSHRLIVDDLIARHNGRITGTAGDSVLAEFHSVVDALDCAVKMQDALAIASESQPTEQRLLFRIGINVGDVMVKDGDIFGDGVNIAARLETLADPGGICVSRGVRDHVRKMGQYVFEDLGEQSVKNIAQPIRAFRVRSADSAPPARPVETPDNRGDAEPAPAACRRPGGIRARFLGGDEGQQGSRGIRRLSRAISRGRFRRPGRSPAAGTASGAGNTCRARASGPRSRRRRTRLLGHGQGQ